MPVSGTMVPSVNPGSDSAPAPSGDVSGAGNEVDRDVLCPICMQTMKDAFLTACGHSYCYMCIATHLRNKNDCPCCGRYLTVNLIFPNFAVDKLLKKISERQVTNSGSYTEQICQALSRFISSARESSIAVNSMLLPLFDIWLES